MRGVQLAECLQAHRGQPQAVSFPFMLSFSPVLLFELVPCITVCRLMLMMKDSFVKRTSFSSRVTCKRAYMRLCQPALALKEKRRAAFIGSLSSRLRASNK